MREATVKLTKALASKRITAAMISAAKRQGACVDALCWLWEQPRTFGDLYAENSGWFWWAVAEMPSVRKMLRTYKVSLGGLAIGARVRLKINTALGDANDALAKGMTGKVIIFSDNNIGVDLGSKFRGHYLGGALSSPTGYWFLRSELRAVAVEAGE